MDGIIQKDTEQPLQQEKLGILKEISNRLEPALVKIIRVMVGFENLDQWQFVSKGCHAEDRQKLLELFSKPDDFELTVPRIVGFDTEYYRIEVYKSKDGFQLEVIGNCIQSDTFSLLYKGELNLQELLHDMIETK